MEERLHHLIKEVDAQQEELIHLLEHLIRFKTPAPPARNTEEAQQFVASFLKEKGFQIDKWDVYPGDPNVVGVLKGSHSDHYRSLIVNGHIDVAEINEDEDWITDPFKPIVQGDAVIGRGAAD